MDCITLQSVAGFLTKGPAVRERRPDHAIVYLVDSEPCLLQGSDVACNSSAASVGRWMCNSLSWTRVCTSVFENTMC